MKSSLVDIGGTDPHQRVIWYCPGCREYHGVPIPPHRQAWQWNKSLESPTLSPSVLVKSHSADRGETRLEHPAICHCFVRDGRIEFLSDCTHDHAGKSVEMRNDE